MYVTDFFFFFFNDFVLWFDHSIKKEQKTLIS